MLAKNTKVKFVECNICKTKVCFNCKDEWHKSSCEANMSKIYGYKRNFSFCPMCKTKIERTKGCNHMSCGFCEYEFCWICHRGATENSNHWNEYSLTGCGVGQLDSRVDRRDLDAINRKKAGKFCMYFFCFPFIVIYEVPKFLAIIFLDQTEGHLTNWIRYPLVVLIFFVGIPLGVIAIPFAIIWCIYLIFHECCYIRCCKKSRNQLDAEERIKKMNT